MYMTVTEAVNQVFSSRTIRNMLLSSIPATISIVLIILLWSDLSLYVGWNAEFVRIAKKALPLLLSSCIGLYALHDTMRHEATRDTLAFLLIGSLLVIMIASALTNKQFHYSYFVFPFVWVFVMLRASNQTATVKWFGLLSPLISVAVCIVLIEYVYTVITSDNAFVKQHGGLVMRVIPSFPQAMERQQFSYLAGLACLLCLFYQRYRWTFLAAFLGVALMAADSRSGILGCVLATCFFIAVKYRISFRSVSLWLFVALCLFLSHFVLEKVFDYPIGGKQWLAKQVEPSEANIALGKDRTVGKVWSNSNVPANASVDPTNADIIAPVLIEGRNYEHFFSDTGGRLALWWHGLERVLDSPWLGNGHFGSTVSASIDGFNSPFSSKSSLYHNSFLQVAVDYGLLALFVWLLFLCHLFFKSGAAGQTFIVFHAIHFSFQNSFLVGQVSIWLVLFAILLPVINKKFPGDGLKFLSKTK